MAGKYALVIGNTEYIDPGLAQLTAPGKDTEDLARILKDTELCAFDDVRILLNQVSFSVIESIDEFFDQKKPDDMLVLYFSGHGVRDQMGSLYLAVSNTIRSRLRSTAIRTEYIREAMDQSRSKRQVLILDCCNSGAFPQGTKAELGGPMGMARAFQGYGRFVLTASDATQFAWEGNKIIGGTENSLFTHFLVKGLEGEADGDGDGTITVDELYDYAYDQISRLTPNQTPTKAVSKQEGEIILRQITRLEQIKPVSLPDDLAEAAEDPRTFVREGTVQQLARLLKGKNRGLARSAREVLERMEREDDSRRVSQAATQVLEPIRQAEELARQKAEEERLAAEKAEEERKAREEAERLAAIKAEEERLAREKAEKERIAKLEAKRRLKEKAEAERKTKEEADRIAAEQMAREEAERLAALKAEEERLAREKTEKERAAKLEAERRAALKAEEERLAHEKAEQDRIAKLEAERKAKEEADRVLAEQKAKEERKAREEAQRITALKAKEEQLRREKVEADKSAKEKAQAESKAPAIAKPVPVLKTAEIPVTEKRIAKPQISFSKPALYGGIGVVLLIGLALIGNSLRSMSSEPTPTLAPAATEEQTVDVNAPPEATLPATNTIEVAPLSPTVTIEPSPISTASVETTASIPVTGTTVSIKSSRAYLYKGPNVAFGLAVDIVYPRGEIFTVLGRNQSGLWFFCEAARDGNKGWLYRDWLNVDFDPLVIPTASFIPILAPTEKPGGGSGEPATHPPCVFC
jgi:hypothetical protein